jgi:hypothetical protein
MLVINVNPVSKVKVPSVSGILICRQTPQANADESKDPSLLVLVEGQESTNCSRRFADGKRAGLLTN